MEEEKCRNCAKQFLCNREKCKPIPYSKTKNYGEYKRLTTRNEQITIRGNKGKK
jgi:hypothetical protein